MYLQLSPDLYIVIIITTSDIYVLLEGVYQTPIGNTLYKWNIVTKYVPRECTNRAVGEIK